MRESDPLTPTRPERRGDQRVRLAGNVRLLLHSPTGIATRIGQVIDLSENGCALRLYKPVAVNQIVQVELRVKGSLLSLPAAVRWVRNDVHSFRVGCRFEHLSPERRVALNDLLRKRRERVR